MNERRRLLVVRVALLGTAGFCGVVTVMLLSHESVEPILGRYSLPALVAVVLTAVTLAASLAAGLVPNRSLTRLCDWLQVELAPFTRSLPGTARQAVALGVIAALGYAITAACGVAANTAKVDDQLDYRRVAEDIRAMGGSGALCSQLFAGRYDEANRHPLYPVILTLTSGFASAKWLSVALGLAPLGLVCWAATRQAGWLVGGAATVLLATNGMFQQSATIVACEIVLIAWALAAWLASDLPTHAAARGVLVGILLGLAYLTKASAAFLLFGWLAWSWSVPGLRRWSWTAAVAFAVISSPLVVRNVRRFGNPLYSFNTRFLFADSFDEGASREFRGSATEAREYFSSHPPSAIARRALGGLAWEGYILLRSLGPAGFGASRPLVGFVVLLLALVGAVGEDRRRAALTATWLTIFFLFFAWYVPIASGDRFLAPVVPPILVLAARGVVGLFAGMRLHPEQCTQRLIWAAAVWSAAAALLSYVYLRREAGNVGGLSEPGVVRSTQESAPRRPLSSRGTREPRRPFDPAIG